MKRLIACCDGTWNDSDSGSGFTNVARIAWATLPIDSRAPGGIPQISYYHSGVGTGDLVDHVVGGGVGVGLSRNMRDAYSFIASNYCDGDEIFLFGFSRGAYTARSLAGLIGWAGILHKADLDRFALLWESYKMRGKVGFVDNRTRFPERHLDVEIKCVGVWDTVGALGVPGHLATAFTNFYEFLDTSLGPHVKNAFHALALDEHRSDFVPTLWTQPPAQAGTQILDQVWFAGAHANVGGGYEEHGLSDIALAWMASKVEPLLAVDIDQLAAKRDMEDAWGHGKIYDSAAGWWRLLRTINRSPLAPNPAGATFESIHASVRERLLGPATYVCPALGGVTPRYETVGPVETALRWPAPVPPPASPPSPKLFDLLLRSST